MKRLQAGRFCARSPNQNVSAPGKPLAGRTRRAAADVSLNAGAPADGFSEKVTGHVAHHLCRQRLTVHSFASSADVSVPCFLVCLGWRTQETHTFDVRLASSTNRRCRRGAKCRVRVGPNRPAGQQPPPFRCGQGRPTVQPGGWMLSPGPQPGEVQAVVYDVRRPGVVIDAAIFDARTGTMLRISGGRPKQGRSRSRAAR